MRYFITILFVLLAGCSSAVKEDVKPSPTPVTASVSIPAPAPAPRPVASQLRTRPEVQSKPNTKTNKVNDSVTDHLFKAAISFVIPDSANVKDDIKAQLLIDPSKEASELTKELRVKGKVTEGNIKISRIALAKLTATDFDVTPITPEQQALTMDEPTEWLWELKPKYAGDHEVQLTITAIVKVDGDSSEHSIKTFEKTIQVKITPQQIIKAWLEKYWQWLFSTLIIPIGLWLYKEKIKKKT